jgi:ADP-ribosylglycohydrolase
VDAWSDFMPYSPELQQLFNEVSLWADLRREQQIDIDDILERLREELKRARKALRKVEPGRKALEWEPNDFEAIRALRPSGPRKIWERLKTADLADRVKGAWFGRLAGCTLGVPVENWTISAMESLARCAGSPFPPEDYWTEHPTPELIRYGKSRMKDYLKGNLDCAPVDDDITYTILGLLILEEYGPDFTTEQAAAAWLRWLPVACTAEDVALRNLKSGVPAAKAGGKNNPYQEWIGADIRSDPWGYSAPGWPEKAAEMAYRDAWLSHRQNGLYGAMYFAAAISAAFAVGCPVEALKIGLTEIPEGCRLASDLRWALDLGPRLKDWRAARAAVDERLPGMSSVHTNNNACLTVFGVILGNGDFTKTIGGIVAMGLDNDCTAATAGSLFGAAHGLKSIPERWWKPFGDRTRTYLNDYEWVGDMDVATRFARAAKQVWRTS